MLRLALVLLLVVAAGPRLRADVRARQKASVTVTGRIAGGIGADGATGGLVSTIVVKGDRKAVLDERTHTSQIVDLSEEKVYDLDWNTRTYRVSTFEALRRRLGVDGPAASPEAPQQGAGGQAPPGGEPTAPVQMDVDVKNTGARRTIGSFETQEAIITVTLHEKGAALGPHGGLVMTTDAWLAPKIPAMQEVADFDARYAQKLYGAAVPIGAPGDQPVVPGGDSLLQQMMGRTTTEGEKLDGTPILATMTIEAVAGNDGVRTTLMTRTTEVLAVDTDVSPSDVAVPVGFTRLPGK